MDMAFSTLSDQGHNLPEQLHYFQLSWNLLRRQNCYDYTKGILNFRGKDNKKILAICEEKSRYAFIVYQF